MKVIGNKSKEEDPFSPPYEKGMVITDKFKDHLLMFNKFYRIKYHSLVVTKKYEYQADLLNKSDFEATIEVLLAMGTSLAFYNHGLLSG